MKEMTARKKRHVLPEEERKEMILDAAVAVFSQHGYEACDVDEIAQYAQIGKGTIYRYFPSKLDLFLATVDRGFTKLRDLMGHLACVEAQFEEKVRIGLRLYVDFFCENPDYYRIMMIEQPDLRLAPDKSAVTGHQRFTTHLIDLIRAGIRSGELKKVDPVFTSHGLRAVASVIIEKHLYAKEGSRKKDIETAIEIFLRGIKK